MVKRILTTLIALVLVFTALLPVGASSVVPMNDTPHEYSVLPGTDAWVEMSTELPTLHYNYNYNYNYASVIRYWKRSTN